MSYTYNLDPEANWPHPTDEARKRLMEIETEKAKQRMDQSQRLERDETGNFIPGPKESSALVGDARDVVAQLV